MIVPLYVDENLDIITDVSDAVYVLADFEDVNCLANGLGKTQISHKFIGTEMQNIVTRGEIHRAKVMRVDNIALYYVKLRDIDVITKRMMNSVGGLVVGNGAVHLYEQGDNAYKQLAECNFDIKEVEAFSYNYKLNKTKLKITQYHHTHVRLIDLFLNKLEIQITGMLGVLAMYLDRFNDVEATHVTFFLYFMSLGEDIKELFYKLLRSYNGIDREWLKQEGVKAKQCQHTTGYDMSKLFELNVLENRVSDEIDWAKERRNRTETNTVNVSYGQVLDSSIKLFNDARREGQRPMKMKWRDYWGQRAVNTPAGAVHSKYECDKEVYSALPREARNKKGFAASLGDVEQEYFLNREPQITAHVSTK